MVPHRPGSASDRAATPSGDPGDTPRVRPRNLAIGLIAIAVVVSISAILIRTNSFGADRDHVAPAASVPPPPAFGHVWVIVIENKPLSTIIGSADAPYLNQLIGSSGLATDYRAVAHPSQPNYVALFSGSTQRVADNEPHDIDALNLADQLEAAGRTWHVYAENVPTDCARDATARDGADGPGTYARKHEPAISFVSISGNPARCARIGPLAGFDPIAADFSLIIPNLCHAMHDCGVPEGDAWLRSFVPRILESPAWRDQGALFITFDEGVDSSTPPNLVATIVSSPLVRPGMTSAVPHTHYSLLRTIQDGFGLPCLEDSCSANTLGEFFTSP